jgi:hypothetical protein
LEDQQMNCTPFVPSTMPSSNSFSINAFLRLFITPHIRPPLHACCLSINLFSALRPRQWIAQSLQWLVMSLTTWFSFWHGQENSIHSIVSVHFVGCRQLPVCLVQRASSGGKGTRLLNRTLVCMYCQEKCWAAPPVRHTPSLCGASLSLYSPVVTLCTARFGIQQFYVLPTQCVYVFCVDLRTNSDYFPIQN